MMYDKKREYIQARRDEELDGIGNLMQLYKFNGRDVMVLDANSTSKCKITKCFCKSTPLVLRNSISFLVSH